MPLRFGGLVATCSIPSRDDLNAQSKCSGAELNCAFEQLADAPVG